MSHGGKGEVGRRSVLSESIKGGGRVVNELNYNARMDIKLEKGSNLQMGDLEFWYTHPVQ